MEPVESKRKALKGDSSLKVGAVQRITILKKMILYVFITIGACIIILFAGLWIVSPGKPKPFLDKEGNILKGSISEKSFIEINGHKMGMFIRGRDSTKPVVLMMHGGPGMPEYSISRNYPLVLEDIFTVCWWDIRGAGLSFNPDIPVETLTFDQFVEDAIAMANYLRHRFNREKIYLMAHSGGTMAGILTAQRAPELFRAYLAISQISNQMESEKLAYKYMIDEFTKAGDKRMLRRFKKYPVDHLNTPSYYVMRDLPMHKLGIGTTHKMRSVVTGVFIPVMLSRELTLKEKINVWRGKALITKTAGLWDKLVRTDLTQKVTEFKIPVYFFSGAYDYTVSSKLAEDYFEKIKAPVKKFYLFEHSAHSPLFEEPEKMRSILEKEVVARNETTK
ncbi:MAG TPA: alpha/beta hydrolase [Lentimicrobium sp.]|nr:alpha/beta hydrolase [Lentimicrobium sp.]